MGRILLLILLTTVVAMGCGCVCTGAYQAKELESLQLSKSLEENKGTIAGIPDKNGKLSGEAETLARKLMMLDGELAALKDEVAKLKSENSKLKLLLEDSEKSSWKGSEPLRVAPAISKPVPLSEFPRDGSQPVVAGKDGSSRSKPATLELAPGDTAISPK